MQVVQLVYKLMLQACHKLAATMQACHKLAATMQGCNNLAATMQGCNNLAGNLEMSIYYIRIWEHYML